MVISCFGSKKPPVRAGGSSLLPPESPRGFSSLARLYYLRAQPKPSCYAGYKHIKLLYWPTLTVGGCLYYTGVLRFFFFKNLSCFDCPLRKSSYKILFSFNQGYVVLISTQPLPEIEEFSLTFKALDLKVLFASHWFRMSGKRNRIRIR